MDILFRGNSIHTTGTLPKVESNAPDFKLVKSDLSSLSLKDFKGKYIILNIFVSLDTSVCGESVKKFNENASKLQNTVILCCSLDLPFAQQRFCSIENVHNVVAVSAFKNPEFGKDYGVTIIDGPLSGLLSRAIVIIDPEQKILYTEQVPEITQEPNYNAAITAIHAHQEKNH